MFSQINFIPDLLWKFWVKKGVAYPPMFMVLLIFFELLVLLVACILTVLNQQIIYATSFKYAINIPDTLMIIPCF